MSYQRVMLPAPVGGLNVMSPGDRMGDTQCREALNVVSTPDGMRVAPGLTGINFGTSITDTDVVWGIMARQFDPTQEPYAFWLEKIVASPYYKFWYGTSASLSNVLQSGATPNFSTTAPPIRTLVGNTLYMAFGTSARPYMCKTVTDGRSAPSTMQCYPIGKMPYDIGVRPVYPSFSSEVTAGAVTRWNRTGTEYGDYMWGIPDYDIVGGGGSTATATIRGGLVLAACEIGAEGSGYAQGSYTDVRVFAKGGTTWQGATANVTVGASGKVTACEVVKRGCRYTAADNLPLDDAALGGGSGALVHGRLCIPFIEASTSVACGTTGVTVTGGGGSYTNGVHEDVTLSGGDGSGAKGNVYVVAASVVAVSVTDPGNGYTTGPTGIDYTGHATLLAGSGCTITTTLSSSSAGSGYSGTPSIDMYGAVPATIAGVSYPHAITQAGGPLEGAYDYAVTYRIKNSAGTVVYETGLSPVIESAKAAAGSKVVLSHLDDRAATAASTGRWAAASSDYGLYPYYSTKAIYRRTRNTGEYRYVDEIAYTVTTYEDMLAEEDTGSIAPDAGTQLPPPYSQCLCQFRDRMVYGANGYIYISASGQPGYTSDDTAPLGSDSAMAIRMRPDGGGYVYALVPFPDKILVCMQDACYWLSGSSASDFRIDKALSLGLGNAYGKCCATWGDVGIVKFATGLYLVDGTGQLTDIGAPVWKHIYQDTCAAMCGDYYLTAGTIPSGSNPALVHAYNMRTGAWSRLNVGYGLCVDGEPLGVAIFGTATTAATNKGFKLTDGSSAFTEYWGAWTRFGQVLQNDFNAAAYPYASANVVKCEVTYRPVSGKTPNAVKVATMAQVELKLPTASANSLTTDCGVTLGNADSSGAYTTASLSVSGGEYDRWFGARVNASNVAPASRDLIIGVRVTAAGYADIPDELMVGRLTLDFTERGAGPWA